MTNSVVIMYVCCFFQVHVILVPKLSLTLPHWRKAWFLVMVSFYPLYTNLSYSVVSLCYFLV